MPRLRRIEIMNGLLMSLPGSPVIDTGTNTSIPSGTATDQRGLARVVRGTVDIGAVEV